MEFNFFWKLFNRFINLLLIHLIMNLYPFTHIYTLIHDLLKPGKNFIFDFKLALLC